MFDEHLGSAVQSLLRAGEPRAQLHDLASGAYAAVRARAERFHVPTEGVHQAAEHGDLQAADAGETRSGFVPAIPRSDGSRRLR